MWAIRTRKIVLALLVFDMLAWGYIVARITLSGPTVQPSHSFIDSLPVVMGIEMTFFNLGIVTFILGFILFLTYLLLEEFEAKETWHCHQCEAELAGLLPITEDFQSSTEPHVRDGDGKEIG